MQRLRRIKQLGFTEFVYPGAGHTRLSHSIGAMQMARRMLNVLERNRVIKTKPGQHKLWRRATLAAALLHDVGHGPFSHVFEEVCTAIGVHKHHEEFSIEILRSREISKLLKNSSIFGEVLSLFEAEAGSSIYSTIISSQLDADRLDFLVRDRYFTGIRFGQIDLEWLFDSLDIEQIPVEPRSPAKQFAFVVKPKGLSVVEDYLLAYSNMYKNVYFHKTTRSVQFMVQDILSKLFKTEELYKKLHKDNPMRLYFQRAPDTTLSDFLELDDAAVVDTLRDIARTDFGDLSELAQRYFERRLYKCFEPPRPPRSSIAQQRLSKFIERIKAANLCYHQDVLPEKGYTQYGAMTAQFLKNILVYNEYEHENRPIAEVSEVIDKSLSEKSVRFYFRSSEDRSRAKEIWTRISSN